MNQNHTKRKLTAILSADVVGYMRIKMKLCRFFCFSLLICFVFPVLSYADQLEDADTAIKNKEYKKAFELLLPLAEENNAEAQTLLGTLYVNGLGVEQDATKGLSLIMKAATQGYEAAKVRAFLLCLEEANQGDAAAMYNVGYMCLEGWGGKLDTNLCLVWLENATKSGHVPSARMLSEIYTKGKFGIIPDEEKASYWINLPAALAAGIDGTWSGTAPTQDFSPYPKLTFTFKADGNTLTGTVTGIVPGRGLTTTPLKDGKIDGNKFSFTYSGEMYGMKFTFIYTGVFLGYYLRLSYLSRVSGSVYDRHSIHKLNPKISVPPYRGNIPLTFIVKRVK